MYAFYETSTGAIISLVDAGSMPDAPDGYGYADYGHTLDEMHKYEVVDGAVQIKSQTAIDQIETGAAWEKLRIIRQQLLVQCDWTQVPDAPVDQTAWATYRQALRDLPANTDDPRNPIWPTPPE